MADRKVPEGSACPDCDGYGVVKSLNPDHAGLPCPHCDGTGDAFTPSAKVVETPLLERLDHLYRTDPPDFNVAMADAWPQIRARLAEAKRDAERLDYLDRMNAALNKRYGTVYGWRLILSHNVVRLMRDGRASQSGYLSDIDLNDTQGGNAKLKSCRAAIDDAMQQEKAK